MTLEPVTLPKGISFDLPVTREELVVWVLNNGHKFGDRDLISFVMKEYSGYMLEHEGTVPDITEYSKIRFLVTEWVDICIKTVPDLITITPYHNMCLYWINICGIVICTVPERDIPKYMLMSNR